MKTNLLPLLFFVLLQVACKETDVITDPEPVAAVSSSDLATIYTPDLATSHNILLNASGYNPRNFLYNDPWTNTSLDQKFQQGLVNSEANMIRYPGGTFGNFWNFETDRLFPKQASNDPNGWVNLNKVENTATYNHISNDNRRINSVADLKFAAKGGTSGNPVKVVFQMNMVTPGQDYYAWKWGRTVNGNVGSNDWYAMLDDRYERFKSMLMRAKSGSDPIDVRFIELGNEYYFPHAYCEEAFPNGAAHGTACNYIANKLKNDPDLNLPNNVRIAATASAVYAGSDTRKNNWNNSLATTLNKSLVGYITLHVYKAYVQPTTYNETNFQTNLVAWYQHVNQKLADSGADANFLNSTDNWRVWYTETNANWDANDTDDTPPSEATWAMNLVDAFSVLHLYERGNAAMLLQFQFNNQVIPGTNGHLYNRAKALRPFMKASKDATSAARISFAGTGLPTLPNSPKGVVQGYSFQTASGAKKCVLINLSATAKHVNLGANIFTSGGSTVQLQGINNTSIGGTSSPNEYNLSYSKSDVTLRPYSVNYIYQ